MCQSEIGRHKEKASCAVVSAQSVFLHPTYYTNTDLQILEKLLIILM